MEMIRKRYNQVPQHHQHEPRGQPFILTCIIPEAQFLLSWCRRVNSMTKWVIYFFSGKLLEAFMWTDTFRLYIIYTIPPHRIYIQCTCLAINIKSAVHIHIWCGIFLCDFIILIDSWLKAINEGKFVGCVMIDFRKAFDLVDHAVLLKKTWNI